MWLASCAAAIVTASLLFSRLDWSAAAFSRRAKKLRKSTAVRGNKRLLMEITCLKQKSERNTVCWRWTCEFIAPRDPQHLFDELGNNWAFNAAKRSFSFSFRHYASHISQCSVLRIIYSAYIFSLMSFEFFFVFFQDTNWAFVSLWTCELTGGRGNAIWIYREPMR